MQRAPVITLLTDFGRSDPFAGILHGVLLTACPDAHVVDLSHDIPPQDVRAGAFWVARCHAWFPPGTVHVAVVDPGVGSARRAIALYAHEQYFVAPDNGLLTGLFDTDGARPPRVIETSRLGLPRPSRTFHGRDVFAPAAARLASGSLGLEQLGDVAVECSRLAGLSARRVGDALHGEVVFHDHFGNLFTNIALSELAADGLEVTVAGVEARCVGTYSEGLPAEPIALVNAFGVVEIAVREGHAARVLALGPGAPVVVRRLTARREAASRAQDAG